MTACPATAGRGVPPGGLPGMGPPPTLDQVVHSREVAVCAAS